MVVGAAPLPIAPLGGRRADLRRCRFVQIFHHNRWIVFRSVFQNSEKDSGNLSRDCHQRLHLLERIVLPRCVVLVIRFHFFIAFHHTSRQLEEHPS